jgi:hypothetical protein
MPLWHGSPMSPRRPSRQRLVRSAVAVAVLVATGTYLAAAGLDRANQAAGVLSLLVSVGLLLWPTRQAGPPAASRAFLAAPGEVLDDLADNNLARAWDDEWRQRRLHDPVPLPVGWANDDALADHWQNIRGTDGPAGPLPLDGIWDDLVDVFERVPSRRLVLVGDGGEGKTVLCLHLARHLLARRARGGPVPVVLALSGWDPEQVGLDDRVAERLPVDVAPGLADDAGDGRTVARAMIEDGHLVLILDGLDELPPSVHRAAVARINEARRGPLFLTCRRAEYAAATARDRITAAAVVRIRPLPAAAVNSWLERTAPPGAAGATKWTPVLSSSDRLGDALASPLLAGLARSVYSETDADPAELVPRADAGADRVEELLLDRLVPTAYGAGAPVAGGPWEPDAAERYLVTLGRGLAAHGTDRLEWWRLDQALPRLRARMAKAALVGTVTGASTLVVFPVVGARLTDGAETFAAALAALVVLVVDPASPARAPVAQRLGPPRGVTRALVALARAATRGLVVGIGVGAVGSVVVIVATITTLGDAIAWPAAVPVFLQTALLTTAIFGFLGAGTGLAVGLPHALLDLVSRPLPVDRVPDPTTVLRTDRRWALARAALFGAVIGVALPPAVIALIDAAMHVFARVTGTPPTSGTATHLWPPDVASVVVIGLASALGLLVTFTAWGRFTFARIYLALGRRAPWRLMAFLADARERGLLRHVGAAYAFRHESLRSRLTRRPDPMVTIPTGSRRGDPAPAADDVTFDAGHRSGS